MPEKSFPNITSPEIDAYCKALTSPQSTYIQELDIKSQGTDKPQMISGAYLGKLLSIMSKMLSPHTILELGTFTGYGTLCLSEGLQEKGVIHTIEKNPKLKGFADELFDKAGIRCQIIQHIGDAAEIIPEIDATFDLVFIDAAKRQYIKYFDLVLPKMKSGGIIIADNVLWKGKVASDDNDKLGEGLDAFNKYVMAHSEVENVLIPIDDGLHLIRKI
jgi:caffeoyl-CoA O-methyltransferase